jgi:hypothetical protein
MNRGTAGRNAKRRKLSRFRSLAKRRYRPKFNGGIPAAADDKVSEPIVSQKEYNLSDGSRTQGLSLVGFSWTFLLVDRNNNNF